MFLFRNRPPAAFCRPSIAVPIAAATARLHTTRLAAADFATYGKTATRPMPIADGDGGDTAETPTSEGGYMYLKQQDDTPEPRMSHSGTRTYVVSPKDSAPYNVPGGAYGSSDPYITPPPTPAPQTSALASTTPNSPHFNTTRVPHNPDGVGDSAAVRFRTAPGSMHTRGGSDGGLGLMDPAHTQHPAEAPLMERNPPPNDEAGRLGNNEAWKHRK